MFLLDGNCRSSLQASGLLGLGQPLSQLSGRVTCPEEGAVERGLSPHRHPSWEVKMSQTHPTSLSSLVSSISKIWNVNPSKFNRIQSHFSGKLSDSVFSLNRFGNAKVVIIEGATLATVCPKSVGKEGQEPI